MDRRTFLIGLLGSLGAASTIIAASSSVEAAPLPEALPRTPEPLPEPTSASAVSEADLEAVEADWSQGRYYRRYYRRRYYRPRFYRPRYYRRRYYRRF